LARWTAVPCYVSSLPGLEQIVRAAGWVPRGWPPPDPSAGRWLSEARRDALRRGDGYVGVEHLLRTLLTLDTGGSVAAGVRRAAGPWLSAYDEVSAALVPQAITTPDPTVTPRLARLGAELSPGFRVDDLAYRLIPATGLAVAPTLSTDTWDPVGAPGEAGPAAALEVFAGPEDGRVLIPRVGESIGRAGGDASHALYEGSRLTDRKLSRRHLVWNGARLDAVKPLSVVGPEGPRDPAADLRVGDVVVVTSGTRLRGVAR
jgi:hypothetical protein